MSGKPWEILQGDVRKVLKTLPPDHFDGVLSDPPYGLAFMGKRWDYHLPSVNVWTELLRVLKPGAPAMLFGGSRTFHRLAVSVEDAGFELRDTLMWMYGSGFPKNYNVAKAVARSIREFRDEVLKITKWVQKIARVKGISNRQIDRHFGHQGMAGHWTTQASQPALMSGDEWKEFLRWLEVDPPHEIAKTYSTLREKIRERVKAEEGRQRTFLDTLKNGRNGKSRKVEPEDPMWQGYGTALKPAFEPIILARRMFEGSVARNCIAWGTGALDIDGSRIGVDGGTRKANPAKRGHVSCYGDGLNGGGVADIGKGRWPANVCLDEEAAAQLDAQSGERGALMPVRGTEPTAQGFTGPVYGNGNARQPGPFYGDTGGASRFFYTAKASKAERGEGNRHPTVKPLDLIRYLAQLILPPKRRGKPRRILVPYAGSGSEMIGCLQAGWDEVVGIEREAEYIQMAEIRIRKGGVFSKLLRTKRRQATL